MTAPTLSSLTRREVLGGAAALAALSVAGATSCARSERSGFPLVREELARMLENSGLAMEAGYTRLEDGMWMVASLHHVAGSSGKMIAWWHERRKTVDEFRRWHPIEHVFCEWNEALHANVYHHRVNGEIEKTKAQHRDTSDYLDPASLSKAGVSAAVCSRGGPVDRDGWGAHIVHLCHDTDYGCEVRTRLFFGDFDPAPPAVARTLLLRVFSEDRARWLVRHQSEEYVYLARFLPELYAREGGGAPA